VARAELPNLDPHGPHDLRHTFATLAGRMVASRLG
jgi:integrase